MQQRTFGKLGDISALTLGGGGIGQVWGPTTREEAIATVRAAWEAGITFFDVAPSYGRGEAEVVLGEALGADCRKAYASRPSVPSATGQPARSCHCWSAVWTKVWPACGSTGLTSSSCTIRSSLMRAPTRSRGHPTACLSRRCVRRLSSSSPVAALGPGASPASGSQPRSSRPSTMTRRQLPSRW